MPLLLPHGVQVEPHNNYIGGLATAFLQVRSIEFVEYQKQVLHSTLHLIEGLISKNYDVLNCGNMVVVNLTNKRLSGAAAEYFLNHVHIYCNRTTVPGDTSLEKSSGICLGTGSLTLRQILDDVVDFLDEALQLAATIFTPSVFEERDLLQYLERCSQSTRTEG